MRMHPVMERNPLQGITNPVFPGIDSSLPQHGMLCPAFHVCLTLLCLPPPSQGALMSHTYYLLPLVSLVFKYLLISSAPVTDVSPPVRPHTFTLLAYFI